MNDQKIILSLCDFSGVWSQPYVDAGYRVIRVDLANDPGWKRIETNVWNVGCDITLFDFTWAHTPWGVLAAPCCTVFCRPAARWWARQDGNGQTAAGVALFRACLRLCQTAGSWWALENPPGRHRDLLPELGQPSWQFQPWHYGDMWQKQTYIWGTATKPQQTNFEPPPKLTYRTPNGHLQGYHSRMSSSRKREREKTPAGFAKAFFEANR